MCIYIVHQKYEVCLSAWINFEPLSAIISLKLKISCCIVFIYKLWGINECMSGMIFNSLFTRVRFKASVTTVIFSYYMVMIQIYHIAPWYFCELHNYHGNFHHKDFFKTFLTTGLDSPKSRMMMNHENWLNHKYFWPLKFGAMQYLCRNGNRDTRQFYF